MGNVEGNVARTRKRAQLCWKLKTQQDLSQDPTAALLQTLPLIKWPSCQDALRKDSGG